MERRTALWVPCSHEEEVGEQQWRPRRKMAKKKENQGENYEVSCAALARRVACDKKIKDYGKGEGRAKETATDLRPARGRAP